MNLLPRLYAPWRSFLRYKKDNSKGCQVKDIMYRMGHKDDETTKNVYLHVKKAKKKEASHKFGELMKNLDVK
jgi:integrase